MKTQANKSPQLVVARFPALKLPTRSGPMQYFHEFEVVVGKIGEGQAVELNAELIDEHRCRKYLHLLSLRDPSYGRLILRTATGADRRRVFIVNSSTGTKITVDSDQGSDGGVRL